MESFFVVGTKLLVMTVMIAVGWFITKKNKFTEKTASEMTWVLLNVVTPCVIINSFADLDVGSLQIDTILLCLALSFMTMGVGAVLTPFVFKKDKAPQQKVYRFAMTFSNMGFMGLPLTQSILGNEGVIYASIFVAVFNFMLWTFGFKLMSNEKKLSFKKMFLNVGTIGFFVGLAIYLPGIQLPEIIKSPIESLSMLNTPIAMLIFGFYIASTDLKTIFTDKKIYYVSFLRLLAMPALMLIIMIFIRPPETMFLSTAIQSCTPAATTTVLFSAMMGADTKLASKVVTATNVLCLITIPIYVTFVQILASYIL